MDVVVVGAGPTGRVLLLAQAGIASLALQQAGEGANSFRAAVLHARTREVFEASSITL